MDFQVKSFTPNWSTKGKPFRDFLFHIQNVHAPSDKVSSKLIQTVELMRWEGWWFLGKLCDANSFHFCMDLSRIPDVLSFGTRPRKLRRSRQLAFLNSERSWIVLLLCRNSMCVVGVHGAFGCLVNWIFHGFNSFWCVSSKTVQEFPRFYPKISQLNTCSNCSNSGLNPYFSGIRAQTIFLSSSGTWDLQGHIAIINQGNFWGTVLNLQPILGDLQVI